MVLRFRFWGRFRILGLRAWGQGQKVSWWLSNRQCDLPLLVVYRPLTAPITKAFPGECSVFIKYMFLISVLGDGVYYYYRGSQTPTKNPKHGIPPTMAPLLHWGT